MTEETQAIVPAGELSVFQLQLLQEIATVGDIGKACETMDCNRRTFRRYLKDPVFKARFEEIFNSDDLDITKKELEVAATGAPKVYEDALNAESHKKVTETCPHCGEDVTFFVPVIDHKTRMKAAETLLKANNLLKETKRVEGEFRGTMVNVKLDGPELLALHKLEQGFWIPPHVYDNLKAKGVPNLPPLPERGGPTILEGNFTEVPNGTDDSDSEQ